MLESHSGEAQFKVKSKAQVRGQAPGQAQGKRPLSGRRAKSSVSSSFYEVKARRVSARAVDRNVVDRESVDILRHCIKPRS